MSNFDKTLEALIQNTYDSGYYSGKHEDERPQHKEAILQRAYAKAELEMRVKALVAAGQRLRSELDPSSIADEALYRLIDDALAPFEEAPDAHMPILR